LDPAGLVLVETELWPNLVHETVRRGVPVAVVNGRLSAERMGRYRRFGGLFRPVLESLGRVGARSGEDAARFVEAGLPESRVQITGDLKYDLPAPRSRPDDLRRRFGIGNRPVVVAGSTRPGEDDAVLDAYLAARAGRDDLFLVLAPRHPERAADALAAAKVRGLALHALTEGNEERAGASDGLLVDAIGELSGLYGIGAASFVGGTLVPVGGHNVLEPAAAGSPVLFGPHTGHVREPADRLLQAGGAERVVDASSLGDAWARIVADESLRAKMSAAAARVVEANRGALQRTLAMLRDVFPSARWGAQR
jgi:3-deoxy-D-manno-octulosonic-acid transferase